MGLFPKALREYLVLSGIPLGKNSQVYIVDPQSGNGDDNNTGLNFRQCLATLAEAEDRCVANQNDCVVLVGGPTANAVTAAIAWDKAYTHLVGLSPDLPGLGQRCRVTGSATADLTSLITFSGDSCIVRNVQFYNGADADADTGAVIVTGDRMYFKNCFFAGMMHATPAARAASFSLKLNGCAESYFEDCTIGTDTVVRAAANAELVMTSASKNLFRRCRFMTYSETAGHGLVALDNSAAGINSFEDCLFYSQSVNWAAPIDNAFLITGSGATYYIDLCRCRLVGIDGWSDTVTRIYTSDPQPNAGAGVPTNPTT